MVYALLISVFVIASCGLVYELIAGTLASYLLGDSVTYFSTIIGTYLFAMLLVVQETHLLIAFPVFFCLAAAGITSIVAIPRTQQYAWLSFLAVLTVVAAVRNTMTDYMTNARGSLYRMSLSGRALTSTLHHVVSDTSCHRER